MPPRLLLCIALSVAPAAGIAQTVDCARADDEETRAQRLREDGRDLDAVRVLEPLLACGREPRRVARLGLAETAAGLWVPAEAHLAEALAREDAWIRRVRRELATQLARVRERVGNLEVIVNAPSGEVRVGGARVATLPMAEPVRVPAGALTYEIVAPGFVREVRRVDIGAGVDRLTRENVALTPEPPSSVQPIPQPIPQPTPTAQPIPATQPTPPTEHPPPPMESVPAPRWMLPTGIAVTVLGVGGVVLGSVAVAIGSGAAETYNDDARCFRVGLGSRDAQCGGERDTADTMQALALGGFIGGAVLTGAGVGLLLASRPSRRPAIALGPGPGTLGIALGGSF